MAPRANWKGFLKLSLVTCPVALFPATSETEKVSFNQINKNTGHRIKYTKVDAETGDEVASDDIIKGYKVDTDTYVTVDKDELENIALESTRTIDIDEFVPRSEIDELYLVRPYYIVPDGKVGHDAYAVIRETIRTMDKVAIARVVLTNREHIIALEARGKGLVGMLLRYPYEIRDENECILTISRTSRSRRRCSTSPSILSKPSPPNSSRTSSRTGTKTRSSNCSTRSARASRSARL
jgi:DNA end-binding protein Ku